MDPSLGGPGSEFCLHSLQSPLSNRQTAVWCSLSTAEAVLPTGKATEGQRGSIEQLPGPFLPLALRGQVGPLTAMHLPDPFKAGGGLPWVFTLML